MLTLVKGGADIRVTDHAGDSPLFFGVKAVVRGDARDNPAIAALFAAMPPVTLHLANAPLHDAYAALFAQVKLDTKGGDTLTSPVPLTLDDPFNSALRTLLRLTKGVTGQLPALALVAGAVQIGVPTTPATEDWRVAWACLGSGGMTRLAPSRIRKKRNATVSSSMPLRGYAKQILPDIFNCRPAATLPSLRTAPICTRPTARAAPVRPGLTRKTRSASCSLGKPQVQTGTKCE